MRSGTAQCVQVRHNDADAVEEAIRGWRASGGRGRPWISVESVYSMDGDRAPLESLMAICERFEAMLVIDEAHATGVFGPDGRGLAAAYEGHENVMCLHTCGKALGASGALVCAPAPAIDFLVNRSRPFIYSTAPSPLLAVAVRAALALLERDPGPRLRLLELIESTNRGLAERCGVAPTGSQIIPVIVGAAARAMALAAAMRERGFDLRGIRPPTVPEGTSRLRISLTLNVDQPACDAMVDALAEELERLPP
jgi:8-amino-7-oxononanoate synthase